MLHSRCVETSDKSKQKGQFNIGFVQDAITLVRLICQIDVNANIIPR